MVIPRSPHQTRQRTRQQGVILDNNGMQISREQNEEPANFVPESLRPTNEILENRSIDDQQFRQRHLEVNIQEFGEFGPQQNEELAFGAPMVNAGLERFEDFGRNMGERNSVEIRNLPPNGHLFGDNGHLRTVGSGKDLH
ncbi:hypothetical protein niasHS_004909 [Heterodera schachtii]|uniref:Uncharacterized protein n=2 Tax=Heterodera TaxID=34509 RepID=A0ABD2JKN0_HETSC